MKTYLSELLSNGNASKFFWTMLTAVILGGVGWLTNLTIDVWSVKARQEVIATENRNVKSNVKEVKQDVKEVKSDIKELIKVVNQISRKV